MKKTYQQAIECLNSLQSNAATIANSTTKDPNIRRHYTLSDMAVYLSKMGYSTTDLNKLNVIHITGTKGKGSTTAFTSSILQSLSPRSKIGLYTSPHLVAVRERIRINGKPITEESFTKYFFDVWNTLDSEVKSLDGETILPAKPAYFRFLTLMAFHTFLSENVDATVLEVGIGGTYDCTNLVPSPTVAAVSSLGLDHTALLGNSIRQIAQNKGGIYKQNRPAISVNQPEDGIETLQECANKVHAPFTLIDDQKYNLDDIELGLKGQHQKLNAKLAIEAAKAFIQSTDNDNFKNILQNHDWNVLPEVFVDGLVNARWPGRCQTVADPSRQNTTWYLDGSHTTDSLKACMDWFGDIVKSDANNKRYLIFNCTNGRSAHTLLSTMLHTFSSVAGESVNISTFFEKVIFCTNITYISGNFASDLTYKNINQKDIQELTVQNELKSVWHSLIPESVDKSVVAVPSIEAAIKEIDTSDSDKQVLVCGSLHLVGGVIEVAGLSELAL
ncbi:FolC bifunctional protein [Wallemia mellicola]|uniref:Folylpolyglutamate synthase n=1 Tax=Wallemia mellicola TaxID=1708541 RepID=A0A4T0NRC6_9BASI|nr:FolC bifunctional protein [Wallemia mellicola]TIB99939.1 FolC bifunctional protein [Wallemia mellicola]